MPKLRGRQIWDQLCSSSWLKSCREVVVSRQNTSAPVSVTLQLKQEPRLQSREPDIRGICPVFPCIFNEQVRMSALAGLVSVRVQRLRESELDETKRSPLTRGKSSWCNQTRFKKIQRGRKKSTMKSRNSQTGPTFKCGLSLDLWYRPDSV